MPNAPMSRSSCTYASGISPVRSIMSESTRSRNVAQLRRRTAAARACFGGIVDDGMRMDQVEPEAAEEQLADEARSRPLALARRFGDVAGFLLGGETCRGVVLGHGTLGVEA